MSRRFEICKRRKLHYLLRQLSSTFIQLNILVNTQNRAVITDFGSARTIDPASPELPGDSPTRIRHRESAKNPVETLTAEVAATGESITITGPAWTVRWAAPELLAGQPPCLASDIWAFGWICWEVCLCRSCTAHGPFSNFAPIELGYYR